MRRRDGKAWKAEAQYLRTLLTEERAEVVRLRKLVIRHHAVNAMKDLEWGHPCPVCKEERS